MSDDWTLTQQFDSPFGTIVYDAFGAGDPLVMIHGTPFSSHVWRKFTPILAETHRVYVYDLVGYGQSEKRESQDVSLAVQSQALAALLDFWRIERPTIIVHDFGGATTLRAHILEQRDYKFIILIDPVAIAPWGSPFVRHVRQHFDAFAGVPAYIHDGILDAYIQDAAHQPLSAETLNAYKAPWTGEIGQAAFYRQIAQMDQRYTDDVQPHYPAIRCPVHLLWGENDGWIPISQGRRLHDMIPGATFQAISGAAHLVQEDQPDTLMKYLLDLLG